MKKYITERRSVRNFDENHRLSEIKILEFLDVASRAPSSMNLQPWNFVVANTPETKAKMKEAMRGNFLQFDTASAIILVLNDKLAYTNAEEIYASAFKLGLMPSEVVERQSMFAKTLENADPNNYKASNFYDIGLFSMNLLTLAKANGLDTSVMRGYDAGKMLEIVEMDPKRYEIVSIIAIGLAKEDGFPTYRVPAAKKTKFLK